MCVSMMSWLVSRAAVAEAVTPIGEVEAQPVLDEGGQPTAFPATPGVYAVYGPDGTLQYIGLSRKARNTCSLCVTLLVGIGYE